MRSPLAALAAALALGICLAPPGTTRFPGPAFLLVLASMCLLAGLLCLRALGERAAFCFALLGFVAGGAAAARLFEYRFPPDHVSHLASSGVDLNDPVRLEGRIVSVPNRTSYGLQFDVEARQVESLGRAHQVTGKVRLRVQASEDPEVAGGLGALEPRPGDSIRAIVRLKQPRVYRNPGSFDFRLWMATIEDVAWVGTVKNPLLLEKPRASPSRELRASLDRARGSLIRSIDRLYPPWEAQGRAGAVLKAVLLGDRSALNSDTMEGFRRTGLYHLLVIAGLHVGLLAMLAGYLLRLFPFRESTRTVLVLIFLLGYAALVEQRAPTLRATLMISVYLVGRLLFREHSALNAIGFAALVLLLHRPVWLFESGFQLSFAAALLIAGLAVPVLERSTEPYRRALHNWRDARLDLHLAPRQAQFRLDLRSVIAGIRGRVALFDRHPDFAAALVIGPARGALWATNMLLFSFVLQLGLMMPMAETFHRVTFAGIALNALAIPVMTAILAVAVPTVALAALWPTLAYYPSRLLGLIMAGLFSLTDLPRLPGWLSFRVPEPPVWISLGFALALVACAWTLGRFKKASWVSAAAAGILTLLISLHPFRARLPRGMTELTVLDCGRGDALFLVLPDRTTMLVDAGGNRLRSAQEGAFQGRRWDPGEDIVSPYLWSRGIQKIDVLVLTHAHEDHLGGLPAIVRNFRIGEFWHGENATTPEYLRLLEQIRERGIPTRVVAAGDLVPIGGTSVRILWPPLGRAPSFTPSNDDSLVMRIEGATGSILLAGDISQGVEQTLARFPIPLESRVLKVAHHGSKSSSSFEFLARVRPRVALISVEPGNIPNLPNPETLARLEASGARVCRTDTEGAVTVSVNGSTLDVRNYSGFSAGSTAGGAGAGAGAGTLNVR